MLTRRFALPVLAVVLTLLAGTAVTASASASTTGTESRKPPSGPTLVAFPDLRYVAPGRTTRVRVGYYDGFTFVAVSKARFKSSNRKVLRVSKVGTVTGVAPGNARVRVRISGQRLSAAIGVRRQILWSSAARTGNLYHGEQRVLHGVGFSPNSEVQFSTNGVTGVSVTPSAAVNGQGTFSGVRYDDGYVQSGPFMSVHYSGGSSPDSVTCPSGAVWIVTATDIAGSSRRISDTCP